MDSCEFKNHCNSSGLSSSREAESNVGEIHIVGVKTGEKVQLNSKDDLNWVVNEIVIVDSLNDKLATGFTSVENESCKNDINYHEHTAEEKLSGSTEKKCRKVIRTSDDSETKLWEYFTEHNSSQLRCNLCLGLFLYQNDAAYLLKHIEVVHKISVLVDSKITGNVTGLTDSETFRNSSNVSNSDVQQLSENTESKNEKRENSQGCANSISGCNSLNETESVKSTRNNEVWRYFTRLETGKIRCNLCCRVLSYNSNELTVIRHLKSNHRDIYQYSIDPSNTDNNHDVMKSKNICNLSYDDKKMCKKTANKRKLQSHVSEYFTRLEARGRMQCKFCDAVVKYSAGIDTNLVRHIKMKHKRIMNKNYKLRFSNNERSLCSDIKEKDTGSIVVLEILEDGDNCLITNAQLQTENDQTALAELTDSVASELNCDNGVELSEGFESKKACDIFENVNMETVKTDTDVKGHSSKIWNYFTRLTAVNASCNICSVVLCCRNSLKKLFHHLSTKHRICYSNNYKPDSMLDFEIVRSEPESRNSEHSNVEYEISKKLTVEDISNINLSSILYSENDNHWIKRKKQSKSRGNIASRLRKYFMKLYMGKVLCNLCGKPLVYKLGHITNLIKHLRLKHKFIFSKLNSKPRTKNNSRRANFIEKMKMVNRTDVVWKFFTKLDENKAECNLCEHMNVFYYSLSSRSNLMKHLRRKHRYFLDLNSCDERKFFKDENAVDQINRNNSNKAGVGCENRLSQPGIDMKVLFDYFSTDKNLEKCIKFEKEQIVCKLCTGMFLFDDLLNFEYTIKYHVQTCHADTLSPNTSVFFDNPLSDDELNLSDEVDEMSDSSSYNELEAISNEISNYRN